MQVKITAAILELLEVGGWTKAKIKALGLSFPLTKGWKDGIIGQKIDLDVLHPLLPGTDTDGETRRKRLRESFEI